MSRSTIGPRNYGEVILRARIAVGVRYLVLIVAAATMVFPILWVTLNAFRDNNQIYTNPFGFPHPVILTNFPDAFQSIHLWVKLANSVIYSGATVVITVLLASMTAFYLAKFTQRNFIYLFFIMGIMIPIQAILIPLFVDLRNLHLLNTRPGLTIIYVATNLSLAILILTGFMRKGIPDELLAAAAIDGCGPLRAFFSVALPVSTGGVVTVATLVFLSIWNDFLLALVMLTSSSLKTLNLAVFLLRGQYSAEQGLLAAGAVILMVPAIVIYIVFQEQVVKGLTAGAVKG